MTIFSLAESCAIAKRAEHALAREFGSGVVSHAKTMIYGDAIEVRFKFTPGGADQRDSLARDKWNTWASKFDARLTPDHFGAEFTMFATVYRIVGIDPGKPKNAISLLRVQDGRCMKTSVDTVIGALARNRAA